MAAAPRLLAALLVAILAGPAGAQDAPGGLLPVPSQTIARGTVVSADMLTEKHFFYDPDRPLSVMTDTSGALGREAKRTLPAGQPIPLNAFREARLVTRGKLTEALFRTGNLTITASVLPQGDGGVGDLVSFKNLDSGRIMSGIVGMDGTIEVSAP